MIDQILQVKLLHNQAYLPSRGSPHSIGLDLTTFETGTLLPGHRRLFKMGFALAIPRGYYGRIAPRSGLALNRGIDVMGGVIDEDYRGELGVVLINLGSGPFDFDAGDRIAQLILERAEILPVLKVSDLSETVRGDGGFGSTGV